ncbi:hypothetical protein MRX96_042005 [Rhipicephalus microplus]
MIFIELVFFSFVLSSKGTKLEPTCPNKTRNQRVLWNCYDDGTCYEKSFYYNAREDKCEQFEYKGCGGKWEQFSVARGLHKPVQEKHDKLRSHILGALEGKKSCTFQLYNPL